jgi:hypothetical protein
MKKKALKDQHGLFQHFQSGVADYNTRENYLAQRGGKSSDLQKLYGLGPEHLESYQPKKEKPGSLSTRYVPGRPGVQALRVSSGVYQDPNTKEIFDYNEGFTTSDGRTFRGGTVDLQTDLVTLANRLDRLGLTKEASLLDSILKKVAQTQSDPCSELASTILMGVPYADLNNDNIGKLASFLSQNFGEESCLKINEFLKANISDQNFSDSMMGKDDSSDDSDSVGHDPEMSADILQAALSTI